MRPRVQEILLDRLPSSRCPSVGEPAGSGMPRTGPLPVCRPQMTPPPMKPSGAVIEIVGVEILDRLADAAGAHELVDVRVLSKNRLTLLMSW